MDTVAQQQQSLSEIIEFNKKRFFPYSYYGSIHDVAVSCKLYSSVIRDCSLCTLLFMLAKYTSHLCCCEVCLLDEKFLSVAYLSSPIKI